MKKFGQFTEQSEVEANVPCVFYDKETGTLTITESSVEVPVTPSEMTMQTDVSGWTLNGTLQKRVLNVKEGEPEAGQNLYYIYQDQFWKATGRLTVGAFRAYFRSETASNARYRIEVDGTGIEQLRDDQRMTTGTLRDLQGREVTDVQRGIVYLLGGMKVMFE